MQLSKEELELSASTKGGGPKARGSYSSMIMDYKMIEYYEMASSMTDTKFLNYLQKNINPENYYIFIYFIMKFKSTNYLNFIVEEILDKIKIETWDLTGITEEYFEAKFAIFILLNALYQAVKLNYREFIFYIIENEKKMPSSTVIKILECEDINLLKEMLDRQIAIVDIESSNLFEQIKFPQVFFQRLDQLPESIKIIEKNNFLTVKHLLYYMYKSVSINSKKRENIIKELANVVILDDSDILNSIIKMKDQDLAEELLTQSDLILDSTSLSNAMTIAIKFNQPRVTFLLYQFIKSHNNILKEKKIHRSLIRVLLDFPENIEVYLFILKRMIIYFSVSDTIYMLSVLDQLTFHKSIEDCKFLCIVNPLKIFVLILELINVTRSTTFQVKTKCDEISEKYMKMSLALIEETNDKISLEATFKDKDLAHRELLYIIAENNFYNLLKNPTVEHLVQQNWNSTYSTQNNFYETSTLYSIINANTIEQIQDSVNNISTRDSNYFKGFSEAFLTWNESMKVKYYTKVFVYFFCLLFFQTLECIFMAKMSPKIYSGVNLRETIKVWIPAFNDYFNGTNFTLSEIFSNINDNNQTFLDNYYLKLSPVLKSNFTLIGQLIQDVKSDIDDVKAFADLLDQSTYVYFLVLINLLFRFIYFKKARIKIDIIDSQIILDVLTFIVILFRVIYVDTKFENLFDFNNYDKYDDKVREAYVITMSAFFICLWLKFIIYLKFTEKIGPLIRIFLMICKSLIYFAIIFLFEFFIFGCIGNLLFATDFKNKSYGTLTSSILTLFRATMNEFNYDEFLDYNLVLAAIFITLHLLISAVILVNFLIAILSNVYEKFQESSILLFYQEIILRKKEILPDRDYGSLLLISFPFNCINLIFLPFYLCCTSRRKLRKLNKFGLYIAYFPLYFIFIIIHTITQILLFPLMIFKLLTYSVYEIFNNSQIIGKKKQVMSDRIMKSFYCGFLFIISPLLFIYSLVWDFWVYTSCLFRGSQAEKFYYAEGELVTPNILYKASEIFQKFQTPEILCDDVINEFCELMKVSNENYDFRNVLLNANHKESLILVKEYTTLVKVVHKLRLKNKNNEAVINKGLFTRLIESNINFCQMYENLNERKKRLNRSTTISSKIFPSGNFENFELLHTNKDEDLRHESNNDSDDDDLADLIELQNQFTKNDSTKKNIVTFSKLPKMFYQRLYMINLQDLKNAMDNVKNSDNFNSSVQKIRTDLKSMKKTVNKISTALNAREIVEKQKRMRKSVLSRRNSNYSNNRASIMSSKSKNDNGLTPADLDRKKFRMSIFRSPTMDRIEEYE